MKRNRTPRRRPERGAAKTDTMKRLRYLAAVCCAVLLAGVTARAEGNVRPFAAGERLLYTVSYRAAMWPNTDMGDVVLAVTADKTHGEEALRIDARATVKGVFSWFYELDDRYYSWLRTTDLRPLLAQAELLEGDYRFSSEFRYDWERDVARNSYRNHAKRRTPIDTTVTLEGAAMDGVSLFYNLRSHDLTTYRPGEVRTLALLLKDKVQYVKYTYYGKETVKVKGLGKIRTLKFSCQLINDDADSFEDGSEFFVWISDDANKVPVLLESPLRVGSVRARLVAYDGLKHRHRAF